MPPEPPRFTAHQVLAMLKRMAKPRYKAGMARFAIPSDRAFGIPMGDLHKLAKRIGRDHALAQALWKTGWYEARMVAAFVDEPLRVSPAQMDRWCRDFDNWAVCDTVCFKLFDRTPHAFAKVRAWAALKGEFQKRAAFALLASIAAHDKEAPDAPFTKSLRLIERAAGDERNFVKKGVNWALRAVGHRGPKLHAAAVALAKRLSTSEEPAARWVGRDALQDLLRPMVLKRMRKRS